MLQQRAFTRIGRGRKREARIDAEKIAEVAEVVATQVRVANELGARELRAVATAAIRHAANGDELVAAIHDAAGVEVHILDGEEEARLAFVGATRTLGHAPEGEVGVVDVGGGSSELALGTLDGGVSWSASFPFRVRLPAILGRRLTCARIHPRSASSTRCASMSDGVFEGLELSPPALGVAVGGSATSLRRLGRRGSSSTRRSSAGSACSPRRRSTSWRGASSSSPSAFACCRPASSSSRPHSDRLRVPLQIGRGGLREGVVLEMIGAAREAA